MSESVTARIEDNVLFVSVTGKIDREDYDAFVPQVERLIEKHGKIRMVADLSAFDGWTTGALWEDLKFDAKHFNDIERLALLGDGSREKLMALFCKPFTTADVRYFDTNQEENALSWVRGRSE